MTWGIPKFIRLRGLDREVPVNVLNHVRQMKTLVFQSPARALSEGVLTLMKLFGYKDQTQGSFGGTLEGLLAPFRGVSRRVLWG